MHSCMHRCLPPLAEKRRGEQHRARVWGLTGRKGQLECAGGGGKADGLSMAKTCCCRWRLLLTCASDQVGVQKLAYPCLRPAGQKAAPGRQVLRARGLLGEGGIQHLHDDGGWGFKGLLGDSWGGARVPFIYQARVVAWLRYACRQLAGHQCMQLKDCAPLLWRVLWVEAVQAPLLVLVATSPPTE